MKTAKARGGYVWCRVTRRGGGICKQRGGERRHREVEWSEKKRKNALARRTSSKKGAASDCNKGSDYDSDRRNSAGRRRQEGKIKKGS